MHSEVFDVKPINPRTLIRDTNRSQMVRIGSGRVVDQHGIHRTYQAAFSKKNMTNVHQNFVAL
jgi:hypothetical protein